MVAIETPHDSLRRLATSPALQGLVLMVLASAIAIVVQIAGRFPDPDSFYHAGMAELARAGEFPRQFPWLALTTLRDAYADLHFLYHLLLVPFVALFGTMEGLRIATIVSVVLFTAAFYALLRALHVRGAFWFTALLLGSAAFMFRANLAKAQGFAFFVLFLGLAAVARRSRFGVCLAALFAAWMSSHWPVLIIGVAVYALSDVFTSLMCRTSTARSTLSTLWHAVTLIAAAVFGVVIAHIINPYFPTNIAVAQQQILDIAFIGGRPETRPGVEWSTLPAREFFRAIGYLLPLGVLAFSGAMVAVVQTVRRGATEDRTTATHAIALGILTVAFAFLTLQSRRHIEFFVPLAILAIAVGTQPVLAWCWPPRMTIGWRQPGMIRRPLASIACAIVIGGFVVGATQAIAAQRVHFTNGYRADFLAGPMGWVRTHVPADELIFHGNWDDFPFFFRHDRTHRYLVGLDPRFSALADAERFRAWSELASGMLPRPAARIIETYGAHTAIILANEEALRAALDADPNATIVFDDRDARVYQLHTN